MVATRNDEGEYRGGGGQQAAEGGTITRTRRRTAIRRDGEGGEEEADNGQAVSEVYGALEKAKLLVHRRTTHPRAVWSKVSGKAIFSF
jgi:hypothetical protein